MNLLKIYLAELLESIQQSANKKIYGLVYKVLLLGISLPFAFLSICFLFLGLFFDLSGETRFVLASIIVGLINLILAAIMVLIARKI